MCIEHLNVNLFLLSICFNKKKKEIFKITYINFNEDRFILDSLSKHLKNIHSKRLNKIFRCFNLCIRSFDKNRQTTISMFVYLNRLIRSQYFQVLFYLLSPVINLLTMIMMFVFYVIKCICWEVYLLFTRLPPTQAWMDPREQRLMLNHIQKLKEERG